MLGAISFRRKPREPPISTESYDFLMTLASFLCIHAALRAEGIEPSIRAWEAHVLPLYYARENLIVEDEGRECQRTSRRLSCSLESSLLPSIALLKVIWSL